VSISVENVATLSTRLNQNRPTKVNAIAIVPISAIGAASTAINPCGGPGGWHRGV
jgi:hypothetical protein